MKEKGSSKKVISGLIDSGCGGGSLEREHMRWLYQEDPEIQLLRNGKIPVYFATLDWSFSIPQLDMERVIELQQDIEAFSQGSEGIFAFSIAGTNHWMALIAHKTKSGLVFYLLDSENWQQLNVDEAHLADMVQNACIPKFDLGIYKPDRPNLKFSIKMSI